MLYIVAGGPEIYVPDLLEISNSDPSAIWIGVDRGAIFLINTGITPDYAIGDFDSINLDEKKILQEHCQCIHEFPSEKDESDLELALLFATKQFSEPITLFGVTGGRFDHHMAAIMLLTKFTCLNEIWIKDNKNEITLIEAGAYTFKQAPFKYISFISISEKLENVTLMGFKYDVNQMQFNRDASIGISNEIKEEVGHISFTGGICLVVRSKD